MVGRLLCKLGIHKPVTLIFIYGAWDECLRCGHQFDEED